MLIEVMVGALVLAITTTAVLNGLDGAQKTGARNKARSVAAALAEQDQERMRSLPVTSVAGSPDVLDYVNAPWTRTVSVKGANYTVTSSAAYATDAGSASTGCSATSKTQTNLRIVSSVSSPATRGTVDVVGLVTPPAASGFAAGQGRIIVKVVDRDQDPIQGVDVALSGTASFSEETNAAGCALFPFAPAGNYTAAISSGSLVGWDGETTLSKAVTSTAGQTTTYGPYEMDQPARIDSVFDTKVGNFAVINAQSRYVTLNNAKLSAQRKTFDAGSVASTVQAPGLFPFLDGYGIYAGQCTTNNPGGALPNEAPGPAGIITTSPKIRVPSINIRVVNAGASAAVTGATVFVTTADGCATTYPSQVTANTTTTTGGGVGALPAPGYPYGSYRICAQSSGTGPHGHADIRASGSYDSRQTSTVVAETGTNLVNDTVASTNAAGTPAFAANPIYPATPILPGTNGAIIVRLNRSGPCH
jgi:type II secretory pathway pseudopilin PulG